MRDLAPDIVRQRLLLEGYSTVSIDRSAVAAFLTGLARHLDLRSYGAPVVHAPEGRRKAENQGFDAFIPLMDSGIALYVWSAQRFCAAVPFTCKSFDARALDLRKL